MEWNRMQWNTIIGTGEKFNKGKARKGNKIKGKGNGRGKAKRKGK